MCNGLLYVHFIFYFIISGNPNPKNPKRNHTPQTITHKLYRNWLQSRSESDLLKYKKYKNKLRLAEKEYYVGRFNEIQGHISKTDWQVIKSILPKSSKCDSIHEVKIKNDVITDPLTICNKFNQYCTCIGSNLAKLLILFLF